MSAISTSVLSFSHQFYLPNTLSGTKSHPHCPSHPWNSQLSLSRLEQTSCSRLSHKGLSTLSIRVSAHLSQAKILASSTRRQSFSHRGSTNSRGLTQPSPSHVFERQSTICPRSNQPRLCSCGQDTSPSITIYKGLERQRHRHVHVADEPTRRYNTSYSTALHTPSHDEHSRRKLGEMQAISESCLATQRPSPTCSPTWLRLGDLNGRELDNEAAEASAPSAGCMDWSVTERSHDRTAWNRD